MVLVDPFVFPEYGATIPGKVIPQTPENAPKLLNEQVGEIVTEKLIEVVIAVFWTLPEEPPIAVHWLLTFLLIHTMINIMRKCFLFRKSG